MTVATDVHTDIDNMMYRFVQTEIDLSTFEAWFIDRRPTANCRALAELCAVLDRDAMPWQDMVAAFAELAH